MKNIGIGLLALGVLIVLFALTRSGAAEYSDTLNIGLLNDKTNLTLTGGFTAVVGAIFAAAGIAAARIEAVAALRDTRLAEGGL